MLCQFVIRLQARPFSRTPILSDRFTRHSLRQRLQKTTETQRVARPNFSYPDAIPLRPSRDLWKAAGFAFGVSSLAFACAGYAERERIRRLYQDTEEIIRRFYQRIQQSNDDFVLSPGMKCAIMLVASNCIVTALWKVPRFQGFMWQYFSNSFASRSLCWPMLLSTFSHSSLLHLGINMYVLWTFSHVAIDKFLGVPQFVALYASAGVISSLTSLMHKAAVRSPIRAVGASGAILGLLAYTCCKIPEARLQIVFLPFFDFSAESAIISVILFDVVGMLLGFRLFDHAAHLGGALFGVAYAQYGEALWKKYCVD